jgi:hypothetical protein
VAAIRFRADRALVGVGAHPEAVVDQLLAGPGRAVPAGEAAGRGRGRVDRQVGRVGPVQGQAGDEADQLAAAAAEHGEGLGLPPPPVRGDPGRGLALVAADHAQHGLPVLGGGRLHIGGAERRPVERRPHDGAVAVQVEQVEEGPLALQAAGLPEVADDEAADPAVQLQVAVGVAPAQVGVQDLAGQVVGEQPVGALLDEREPPQPAEQLVGVAGVQGRGQQRLAGHPDVGAGLQGLAVAGAGQALHEPLQQGPDHVRPPLGGEGRRVAAGGRDVGHQRQGQGVAVGERQGGRVLGGRDAAGAEVGPALGRAQVAQRHHPGQVPPAGVGQPAGGRRVAPGQHDQVPGGQLGQQRLPQPGVQRGQGLVGVDQQHAAGAQGQGLQRRGVRGLAQGPAQGGQEARRRRVEVAPVQPHRRDPGVGGQPGELAQQDGLADPAGAVDVQEGERRLGVGQRGGEQRQLRRPPDKAPAPGDGQPVAEPRPAPGRRGRCRHHGLILRHRRPRGQARGVAGLTRPGAGSSVPTPH